MKSFKSNLRAKFCAIAIAGLLFSAAALPVWAQHDMQNMPGMNMGSKAKSRPKSKSKSKTGKKSRMRKRGGMHGMNMPGMNMPSSSRSSSRSTKAAPQKMDMNMPGMNMSGMNMPAQTQSAQPSAKPEQMNMPGMQMPTSTSSTNPSASPEKMDMSMPGMQMPSSPSTTAKPSASPEKMDMNMPGMTMPQASTTPNANQTRPQATQDNMSGMGNMNMGAPADKAQSSDMNSMPGMGGGEMGNMPMGPNPLVVMEGDQMNICIGPGTKNTLPMGQMGSGSSWQPSTTPMFMYSKVAGKWTLFVHGEAKLGVNSQGGPRGVTKFESQNWVMPMAYRRLGPGTLQLRGMFSLEPFSLSPGGSPQLFQTGETYKGQPLIDKQHPHDLFMELSSTYTVALGEKGTWFTYFGFPGEPALGPTAFMHRQSASENPAAPLGHHLEDSTHISFGVFSTGFTYRGLKLEGSLFNGQEPDENRYNFEFHPWNSRSARLSYAPNDNWSMQVSYGFLKHPEATEPGDIRRTTASIGYNKPFKNGNWATTLIWGRNHVSNPGEVANLNGYTAESTVNFLRKNYLYTRLELVDKNELLRAEDRVLLGIKDEHPSFRIGAYTFGGTRDIWNTNKVSVALGADVTFYSKPAVLDAIYGNNPTSYHFFVRIRPSHMSMTGRYTGKGSGMNDTTATIVNPQP